MIQVPTTAPKNGQLIELAIKVAHGEVLKKDYAEMVGVDPTRVSSRLNEDFASAIKDLQADRNKLQELESQSKAIASRSQELERQLQAEIKELQFVRNDLQAENATLQAKCSELQAANTLLQATGKKLQARVLELESDLQGYKGKPKMIQFFGSPSTRAFLAVLLAFFEMAGSIHLLWPKGALLAVPVGVAMGFSLLAFASSDNEIGKWVCIIFSFAVGIIYFAPWSTGLPGDWLFAFVPPVINATIINSFKNNK